MGQSFKALVIDQFDGKTKSGFQKLDTDQLPAGELSVDVSHSTVNYKDGLAVSGKGKIARKYPMVGGIDLAGVVTHSTSADFRSGDPVVVCGGGLSETHWGGYAEKARVPADWAVKIPAPFSASQAMAIGTAGFTAMLAVMALERVGLEPGPHEVIVTGAAGGVGSVAVALLSKLGYKVAASTGRAATHDYLKGLGATTIVAREELNKPSGRPLDSERWAGGIDSLGGETLASVLRQTRANGAVAACGLAENFALPTTVMPFILRGVSLLGINSVILTAQQRRDAWRRLARDLDPTLLDAMTQTVAFDQVPRLAEEILKGQVRGRTVVAIKG
ncbi:MAG: oxidoreductase [Alphaproteobacteria bacterium]|nr:oxidoreductase [Alphaproteobacteria bacterium]